MTAARPGDAVHVARPVDADLLATLGRGTGDRTTVLLHAAGGGIGPYLGVADRLARRGPVYAVRAAGLLAGEEPDDDIPTMVDRYARLVSEPPRLLLGWSMGGVLAWELAARFAARGHRPAVVLVDSSTEPTPVDPVLRGQVIRSVGVPSSGEQADRLSATVDAHLRAISRHTVRTRYDGPALLIRCADATADRWAELHPALRVRRVPCTHFEVFDRGCVETVVAHTEEFLA